MANCKLQIADEVNIKLIDLPLEVRKKLVSTFKYQVPQARYHPAYKLGRWDGTVSLFGLGGNGFLNQLPIILPILEKYNVTITEIEDLRLPANLHFDKVTETFWADKGVTWPVGHVDAGKPVMLRDYQVEAINTFLENPQALQEIATGAGKCRSYDSLLSVTIGTSDFNDLVAKHFVRPNVVSIGNFCTAVELYNGIDLQDNCEYNIADLQCYVPTPYGSTVINCIIKKENLTGVKILLANSVEIECAEHHILITDNLTDVYAKDLRIGDAIQTNAGLVKVLDILPSDVTTFYDIGIDAPHLYFDPDGVMHHNTITTATLAKVCESLGRTITIVPNKSLVEQTAEDFMLVGLDAGMYYGDCKDLNKTHTICTWQSLNMLEKKTKHSELDVLSLTQFLEGVKTVIVDECHQASASVLKNLLTRNLGGAPIRWGLTGTVPKEKHEYESIFVSLGPVVGGIKAHELQDRGVLSNCHVNILQLIDLPAFKSYPDEVKYLVTDATRLAYLAKKIEEISQTGNTLVLVNRIDTGKQLIGLIQDSVFVSGEIKTKDRKKEYDEIKTSTNKILIASYGVAAVGLNLPRIFNLVLLEPGKSFVRVIQSIGRGIRKADDKDHVEIFDITSTCKFAKRHLSERKQFYKDAKYDFSLTKIDWSK